MLATRYGADGCGVTRPGGESSPGGAGLPVVGLGSAHASGSGKTVRLPVSCQGASESNCKLTLNMGVNETVRSGKVLAIAARAHKHGESRHTARTTHYTVIVGSKTVTLSAGPAQGRDGRAQSARVGRREHHHPKHRR
ncbi:MAG: hypothetical protein ACRDL5_05160 [Solirubrobacteraceae bacterium]